MFSAKYLHFFYALHAEPPHALLAHSDEWCLPTHAPEEAEAARAHEAGAAEAEEAAQSQCESVQFVSGLEIAHGDTELLLAYGANDCQAKAVRLPLATVLGMLRWPPPPPTTMAAGA